MIALTGQRRVGKSCVMRRIYNHIAENEENHVIYIDKEKTSFDMIANYQDLEAYVAANIVEGKENYLFIDEVQEISDFEKALLSIQSDDTNHGKTKSARIQKRNVFSTDKNEM